MVLQNMFGDIATDNSVQEVKNSVDNQSGLVSVLNNLSDTLVHLFASLVGQMPRLDALRRSAVNVETGTLSTVSNITSQGGYPAFFGLNPTPWGIYDRIVVS